jgi:uncharacterized protein YkwD
MFLRTSLVSTALVALTSALAGCSGATACDCGPTPPNPLDAEENAIVQDLNIARGMAGAPAVTVCKSLNVSATRHSDDMRDNNYLGMTSPNGSDVRARACMAGYTPACATTIPMAELLAEGNGTGDSTYMQWAGDPNATMHLLEKDLIVVGLGHSIGLNNQYWTLDMASMMDASCN